MSGSVSFFVKGGFGPCKPPRSHVVYKYYIHVGRFLDEDTLYSVGDPTPFHPKCVTVISNTLTTPVGFHIGRRDMVPVCGPSCQQILTR